jgi:hypothetical protein
MIMEKHRFLCFSMIGIRVRKARVPFSHRFGARRRRHFILPVYSTRAGGKGKRGGLVAGRATGAATTATTGRRCLRTLFVLGRERMTTAAA